MNPKELNAIIEKSSSALKPEVQTQTAENIRQAGEQTALGAGSLQEETAQPKEGSLQEETAQPKEGSIQAETASPQEEPAPPETASPQEEPAPPETASPQGDTPQAETASPQERTPEAETASQNEKEESPETNSGELSDKVKDDMLSVMKNTKGLEGGGGSEGKGQEDDPYFDKLTEKWNEASAPPIVGNGEAQKVKKEIGMKRASPLYQAVLVSRLLKENKPNPVTSGIFSRMMNSSVWGHIGDLNAGVTGATGLLSTFDQNSTSQTVYKSISLVTSFVTVISSIRNIFQKIKGFMAPKNTWVDKLFLGIGILGDFSLAFAKAVDIAKTITKFCKKDLPALNKISNWMFLATGTSQAIALTNLSRSLVMNWNETSDLKKQEGRLWEKVSPIAEKVLNRENGAEKVPQAEGNNDAKEGTEQEASTNAEGAEEEKASADAEGAKEEKASAKPGEAGKKEAAAGGKNRKNRIARKMEDNQEEESRLSKARKTLEILNGQEGGEEDQDRTEKNKDDVVKYVGLSKRIQKKQHDMVGMVASGVNLAFGLGASIISGGKFVTAQGAGRTKKGGWKKANDIMSDVALGAKVASSSVTLLATGTKVASNLTNQADDRSRAVEERLFGKLETLGNEEHGLKYLENSLVDIYADEKKEHSDGVNQEGTQMQEKGKKTLALYADTEEMFKLMGVPTMKLIGAKDLAEFKKILVSSLV